jgi:hypothetical protein
LPAKLTLLLENQFNDQSPTNSFSGPELHAGTDVRKIIITTKERRIVLDRFVSFIG